MASIVNTKGVDISDYQGDINLSKVKSAGYNFVMIKCGQGGNGRIIDSEFTDNVKKAEQLGMPWGVYLFTEACSTTAIKDECDKIDKLLKAEKAKGYRPTLPIALDLEYEYHIADGGGWNESNVKNITAVFVSEMLRLGYYPVIYTGYYQLRDWISTDTIVKCDVWLSQWNYAPDWTRKLGLWQYGGEKNYLESNSIPGVGVIDKDKVYKDYPAIIKNGGYNGWGNGTPKQIDEGTAAQLIIDTAYALLNVDEHPDSCDIMNWYGTFSDDINDVACCCAGQMYLFNHAGALDLIPGGKVADCGSLCRNFYDADQLYGPDEVRPGDLVIFSWSKERSSYWPASSLEYKTLDHVELCVAVYDDTIKCIGANNGGDECDDFQIKTRDKSNISCCCRPKYSDYSYEPYSENEEVYSEDESSVASVQSWLNNNYSADLDVDDIYGPRTKAALVKALQTELNRQCGAGLMVDGIYGNMTSSAAVCLFVGAQGNITKILQGFLICNGYSTNGFDGIFGSGTMNAVKSFQRDNDITADGIVGPVTWMLLAG
ncbi:peptidoglycan-binding protein [Ruminococcus difficilis]|uniref:Peptidoglycan-binding protein n=1 Tax=Ruminococcus difficilis TaxID=2763069 RepID=A0A934WTF4_9FIRM|nr:peptidoglycan-binding protein [Ruminococcus difficilis]MBK6089621.1 peptidoglycan-binding protein [Ruminococcus difficilis]